MKKSIKSGLALLIILSIGISGCGKKNSKTTEKKVKKTTTTTANERNKTKQAKKSKWIIELDPGHGGKDSGAEGGSQDKLKEKDINLKIAKYVKQELSSNPNIQVYLTREGDMKPDLWKRVSKAVEDKADLFISFHNNSKGEITDYDHGCTVIVPTGNYNITTSEQAQLLGCYFLKYLEKAGLTNQGLLMRTSEKKEKYYNGALEDYYGVIHTSVEEEIPGVIVEHSFIDNDSDAEQFLSDDKKIQKLAKADAKAITDYCFGNVKQKEEVKQKVTLIKDAKGKNNQYSSKTFTVYECDKKLKKKLRKNLNSNGTIEEIPYDKEYKKYDLTGDGVKDSFCYKDKNSEEGEYTIYLNHKKLQKIFCARGGSFYCLQTKDKKVYLIQLIGQFGGNSIRAFRYDGQKFREVISMDDFEKYSFREQDIEKYENGILYTITEQVKPEDDKTLYTTFKARMKYRIKGDKLKLASRYYEVINPRECKAASSFKTSKTLRNIKKQDGFEIKEGDKVLVKKVYLYDKNKKHLKYAFKIQSGKNEGWFIHTEKTKFAFLYE